MSDITNILVVGTIAALLTAAPAFAQYNPGFAPTQHSPYEAYGAVTPFGSPTTGPTGGAHMNAARAAAMRTSVISASASG